MMRKQYLYSSVPIPRRTRYRQRLRERQLASNSQGVSNNLEPRTQDCMQVSETIPGVVTIDETIHSTQRQQVSEAPPPVFQETDSNAGEYLSERTDSGIADIVCSEEPTPEASGAPFISSDSATSSSSEESDSEGSTHEADSRGLEDIEQQAESNDSASDSDTDEAEGPNDIYLRQPLSESTSTTVGDALLMCLAIGLRHSLSWAAIVDILSMINHLFDRKVIRATKYFFLKYMKAAQEKTVVHIYCPYCERYLGCKNDVTDLVACQCGTVMKDINEASTYFLSLSLGEQIKELLLDKHFLKAIDYRFTRKKINEDAFEDIYDGEVYKSLSAPGEVLWEKYNISYSFNTDGFPVGGKSGKQTCWPIYVQINELPPHLRSKYMLLAGIYVGEKDPNMNIFLYPFVEEANSLSSVGINWTLKGKAMNSKCIPLCACVDTPARAKLLNMAQFNGYYGCTVCYCKAENIGNHQLRYTIPLNGLRERTHEEILMHAAKAHANYRLVRNKKKRSVKGVKGISPMHTMKFIDLAKGIRPEPMHSQLLGNTKNHTIVLQESAGKEYFIGSDVRMEAINNRLLSIKPPSSIMRSPRPLQRLSQWKATEWRSWVLFYGVVCLKDIIPDKYVIHFSMLSSALHIIFQQSVTRGELEKAHIILLRYVFLIQEYFGKNPMVYNVHLLLHTQKDVEYLGPAWTHTAFGFEGANKTLLQFKKGTSSVAKEIATKYITFKALPLLSEKYASSESAIKFCEQLSGRPLKSFSKVNGVVLVGSGHTCVLDPEEHESLRNSLFVCHREVTSYDRIIYNKVKYCTGSSCQGLKYDDSYICICGETRGRIQRICSIEDANGSSVAIFVRELVLDEQPLFSDDYGKYSPIKRIHTEGQLLVIRPQDISTQCVAMFLDNGDYICDMPFGCYSDS